MLFKKLLQILYREWERIVYDTLYTIVDIKIYKVFDGFFRIMISQTFINFAFHHILIVTFIHTESI